MAASNLRSAKPGEVVVRMCRFHGFRRLWFFVTGEFGMKAWQRKRNNLLYCRFDVEFWEIGELDVFRTQR